MDTARTRMTQRHKNDIMLSILPQYNAAFFEVFRGVTPINTQVTVMFRNQTRRRRAANARPCRFCQSHTHSARIHQDCPFNPKNIKLVFLQLGLQISNTNVERFIRDFEASPEWEEVITTGNFRRYVPLDLSNYTLNPSATDSAELASMRARLDAMLNRYQVVRNSTVAPAQTTTRIPQQPRRRRVVIKNSGQKLLMDKLKKAGLLPKVDCELCCEEITADQIYTSKDCKCSYIYCKTCWYKMPDVPYKTDVKKCPSCRVETKPPTAVSSAAL